jgi:cysteinyl-tRNA synthetase
MDDDFNTALALSYVLEISKNINKMLDDKDESAIPLIAYTNNIFLSLNDTLGLLKDDLNILESQEKVRHMRRIGLDASFVENAINKRMEARKNKDYQKSDEIRNMLLEKGIALLDTPKGTEWRIKHTVI